MYVCMYVCIYIYREREIWFMTICFIMIHVELILIRYRVNKRYIMF